MWQHSTYMLHNEKKKEKALIFLDHTDNSVGVITCQPKTGMKLQATAFETVGRKQIS